MPKKIIISKIGNPEVLEYIDYELPNTPQKNEVRIKAPPHRIFNPAGLPPTHFTPKGGGVFLIIVIRPWAIP